MMFFEQILLKDFTDDKNALLDAFQKIPYNGVGKKTDFLQNIT